MEATCMWPSYFGEDADSDFMRLADVVFVISKGKSAQYRKELLVHSQIISLQCKVLSPLLALASEGSLQPAKGSLASSSLGSDCSSEASEPVTSCGSESSSTDDVPTAITAGNLSLSSNSSSSSSRRNLLVIEQPLAAYSEEAVELLLTFVYTPGSARGSDMVKKAAADKDWALLDEVVRLADQLHAAKVLATVECTLLECLPADCTKTETWLPLLLLADTHSQQLPQLFSRALTTASQAAVGALDGSSAAKAQPLQAFLASHDALKLSKQTLLSVMASFAAGARAVERNRLGGATFDKWEGAPPLLVSGSPCIGSYEWSFSPDFSDLTAIDKSDNFEMGGVTWYVAAYRKPGDKNAVKKGPCMGLFLFAPMLEGEGMLRTHRLVDYSFTILSRSSEVPPITHHIKHGPIEGGSGFGPPRLAEIEVLKDPANAYLVDGKLTVEVKMTRLAVLDM